MSRLLTVIAGIALCMVAGWTLRASETLPDITILPLPPIASFNGPTLKPIEVPTSVMPVIFGGVLIWFSTLARERRESEGRGTLALESLLLGLGLAIVGVFLPFYFLRLLSTPSLMVGRVFALLALTAFICGGFWYFQPEHKPVSLAGKAGALAAVLARPDSRRRVSGLRRSSVGKKEMCA